MMQYRDDSIVYKPLEKVIIAVIQRIVNFFGVLHANAKATINPIKYGISKHSMIFENSFNTLQTNRKCILYSMTAGCRSNVLLQKMK